MQDDTIQGPEEKLKGPVKTETLNKLEDLISKETTPSDHKFCFICKLALQPNLY